MKVLVFSDVHSDLRAVEELAEKARKQNVEVMICAGDLSNFGMKLKQMAKRLESCKKPLLIIPGNHESEEEIGSLQNQYIVNLHNKVYSLGKYIFYGYGGGGFSLEDNSMEDAIMRNLRYIGENVRSRKTLVLVTHAPPFGTKADEKPYFGHCGSKTVAKAIKKLKPVLAVCGHIHEAAGAQDKIGGTIIVNPGKAGMVIEI